MTIQEQFINQIAPLIQKHAPKYDIRVCSPIIAQACAESKYGQSGLAKYFNLFGLKAGTKWQGPIVAMKTKEEYVNGVLTEITDNFRVYSSMENGVIGFFEFLGSARYQNLKGITDPKLFCETIKADGYATSTTYVTTLMGVIQSYTLTKYDPVNQNLEVVKPVIADNVNNNLSPDVVIKIALAEVGYLEKANGNLNYLYDKTANAGDKNYTKYGYEMHQIYPQTMDYPAAWCDCFVDWCFFKAYGISNAKSLIGGNFDDYTVNSAQLYKNNGSYIKRGEGLPQAGDQIFFRNSQRICHTGIVIKVDGQNVYTVEGNTSSEPGVVANGGCVRQKVYSLNYANIDGYGRPKYTVSSTQTSVSTPQTTFNKEPKFYGKVNAEKLNVRKGAGTNFANLVSYPHIHKDDKVGVCDTQKASNGDIWYYIQITGNQGTKYGFVNSKYITKIQESNNTTSLYVASSRDTSLSGTYIVTASVLNMRKGSSTETEIIKKLPRNTKVQCYGYYSLVDNKRWLYVTDNKDTGFCSENFLKKV